MREEQEYNVRFVKSVESHRCVYDFTLADYSNKERQEEAWIDIAREMGSPGMTINMNRSKLPQTTPRISYTNTHDFTNPTFGFADCKERWRNLRGSLTRHLKLLSKDDRQRKPYYLTEHMQFIVPYTKTRSRAVLPFIQESLNSDELFPMDKLADDDEDEGLELMQPPAIVSAGKRSGSPDGESAESMFKFKRPREDTDGNGGDPDLNFFISLLPDVRCMDSSQKRQMKMGVLKLIDDILT